MPASTDVYVVSPTALVRALLADFLRTRLAIRCGMAASVADLPAATRPRLLIWDSVGGAHPAGIGPQVRVLQIDGASEVDDILDAVRNELRIAPASSEVLTPIEIEVLRSIASGRRSVEIAHRQRRSVKTVEKHRANLQRKLGIRSVAQLTAFAIRAGLVDLETVLPARS